MEETVQFNLRVSKALLADMDFIAAVSTINRNDWVKVALSELIADAKRKIIDYIENRFILGRMSEEEFIQKMGFKPTEDIKKLREKEFLFTRTGKLSVRKYLQEIAKKSGI